jgi:hypothetical protein
MLKKDKIAFEDFVSRDPHRQQRALAYFESLELGYFEDHPLSKKLIKEHIVNLIEIWNESDTPKTRDWIVQFIADAGVANTSVKPIILSGLRDPSCPYLPTLLYLIGNSPELFADIGSELDGLAKHPESDVRWRVAWVISKMKDISPEMRSALRILENDPFPTTITYVRICKNGA